MRNRTRIAVIAIVAMLGVGAAGLAWAWFTETTTATAQGSGGTISDLTVSSSTYDYEGDLTALYPGDFATVLLTINNPNSVPMYIADIAGSGKTATGATPSLCAGANLVQAADPGFTTDVVDNVIPANGTAHVTLTNAIYLDGPSTPNECQGMTFSTSWAVSFENR